MWLSQRGFGLRNSRIWSKNLHVHSGITMALQFVPYNVVFVTFLNSHLQFYLFNSRRVPIESRRITNIIEFLEILLVRGEREISVL